MIFHHFYLTFYTLQYIISQRRPPTCCGPHSPPHIQTHRPYDSASSTLNLMSDIRFHWRKFTTTLPCLSLYLTLVHTGHSRLTQAKHTHKISSPESWKRPHTFTPSSSRPVTHLDPVFFRPVYHSPPPFVLPLVLSDRDLLLLVVGLLWSKASWLMACSAF